MTRRGRLERLEAQMRERVGPEDVLDFYGADLERGVWVGLHSGQERPMSEEEQAQARAASETGGAFMILGALGPAKPVYGVGAEEL